MSATSLAGEANGELQSRGSNSSIPFPVEATRALIGSYPELDEIVWVQEEPQNMGAWYDPPRQARRGASRPASVRYVGRPWRASTAEGYPTAHTLEQERIALAALTF